MEPLSPPVTTQASLPPLSKTAVVKHLWRVVANGGNREPHLYFLIDAARDPAIYRRLRQLSDGADIASLYQGRTAEDLATVAPYLIHLGMGGAAFDWLWNEGWGKSWGIFLWSPAEILALRSHLRTLTKVKTEDGQVLLFRFYDPRVLPAFLGSCDNAQVREFFGPVSVYTAEGEGGASLEEFTQSFGTLKRKTMG